LITTERCTALRELCLPSLQEIAISVDHVWFGELGLNEVDNAREVSFSSVGPVGDSLGRRVREVSRLWGHWGGAVVEEDKQRGAGDWHDAGSCANQINTHTPNLGHFSSQKSLSRRGVGSVVGANQYPNQDKEEPRRHLSLVIYTFHHVPVPASTGPPAPDINPEAKAAQ
jgi:hypothetical protein